MKIEGDPLNPSFVIQTQMRIGPTRIRRNIDPKHRRNECVASALSSTSFIYSGDAVFTLKPLLSHVGTYSGAVTFLTVAEPP